MNKTIRHVAYALIASLALVSFGFAISRTQAQLRVAGAQAAACTVPAAPSNDELTANADSSATITWPASPGATSYNLYRGTTSGGEGSTPIAHTTSTTYTDKSLSSTTIYFYQITAVNSCGESARSAEDETRTPPPVGTGGNVPGVPSGNGEVYYAKDALLGGFDWFQALNGWYPEVLGSSGSLTPGHRVVDMAYSNQGGMTFNDVVVPTSGLYTVDWRYAFQGGLFPGVNNRQMGLEVNGTVITGTERFPITGSFETYQHTSLQVHLKAGVNSITMFAVSSHGVSRVDQMTVTPATASVPSGPTNLSITPGNTTATLSWKASTSGNPASYSVYRGTKSDGEAVTPIATVSGTTTTFTDTGLNNGKTYFYNIAANNSVGVSPDSNEVSVTPGSTVTAPSAPTGLIEAAFNGTVVLAWNPGAGASSYSIYRGTAPGAEGSTPIGMTATPGFTDAGLANGTTYYYTVTASNSAGTSAQSADVQATPVGSGGPGPGTAPSAPAGLVATGGNGSVGLTWNASAGVTSYSIYRGTAPGAEGAAPVGTATSNSFNDTGLANGTTYYYTITASNSAGTSAHSTEVHAAPTGSGGSGGTSTLLSQAHPATASSVQSPTWPASNAFDGNLSTRWSSAFSDPQWLEVDLGATHTITQVVLNWEHAYATAFQIQTSTDGTNWTTVYSTTTGTGGVQTIPVTGSGRYVRMYGTKRATGYGYSLWEFQVFGT